MADVSFRLEVFEGPLDLLLHLLSKNKIEIKDSPIAEILTQYLAYIEQMREFDMEVAADFISMAAQLVYIKSKMLLPVYEEEDAEDPRAALIQALEEYQRIKQVSSRLGVMSEVGRDLYVRPQEPLDKKREQLFRNTPQDLLRAIQDILERSDRKLPPPIRAFTGIVGREPVPVDRKIDLLIRRFKQHDLLDFSALVLESGSRSDIVALFLAVLELSKSRKIMIEGEEGQYYLRLAGEEDGV